MERRLERRIKNVGVIESYSFQGDNSIVEINRPFVISLKDISIGGLGISCEQAFDVGTTLSIDLLVNDSSFVVIGRIVWCHDNETHYECGLRLIYIPELLADFIETFDEETAYMN